MATMIVDPTRFYAEGAIIGWRLLARRRKDIEEAIKKNPEVDMVVHLRWILREDLGMPTEPFIVWRRPRSFQRQLEKPVNFEEIPLFFLSGAKTIDLKGSYTSLSIDVQVANSNAGIAPWVGSPSLLNITNIQPLGMGTFTMTLADQVMDGLIVTTGVTITSIRGIKSGEFTEGGGWEKLEIVGLPVDRGDWAGIGNHAAKQGLVAALTTPKDAAGQRLKRGMPLAGWEPELAAGVAAPVWQGPDPGLLIDEVSKFPIAPLRQILAGFPPNQQAGQRVEVTVPPPANTSGQQMNQSDGKSLISPIGVMSMGVGSDPFVSLVLGFGTAYPVSTLPVGVASNPGVFFDYMITARWEKGLNGNSEAVEFAALVPSPGPALPPPAPANVFTELMGHERPVGSDRSWQGAVRISWDRLPSMNLLRVSSFAAARASVAPPGGAVALMEARPSGGFVPIASNKSRNDLDPEAWRMHAVARSISIPNNPGTRTVKCAAATQNLYGLWSPWSSRDHVVAQPDPDLVRIVNMDLKPVAPASGAVCDATLGIEFLWDWRIRGPKTVRFVANLYAMPFHGAPPASNVPAAGLQKSLAGGAGVPYEIEFTGDVPGLPNAQDSVIALSEDGDKQVAFGPQQGNETRRYRVMIKGFSLNYAATGHIGCALWAQAVERLAPQRVSLWSPQPNLCTASDPRPPVIPPDIVDLASLPDAAGECHARISWSNDPGAVGYFIYESTESKILESNSLPEATPNLTLSQRLTRIKNAFKANPSRREFTRRNARLIQGTSADVTLPKGSTSIHVYIVMGVSAGQVEAKWPSGQDPEDQLIAVAAPRVMVPTVPTLEVARVLDKNVNPNVFRAAVLANMRSGPRVQKVELHRVRVDDAARELNTMGPPVLTLANTGGGWTVTRELDGAGVSHITKVSGQDTPSGSWRRVWYRAVAWSEDDPLRGALRGKSSASNAAWIVVPPNAPPNLSALTLDWPGGPLEDVLVKWTSTAPLKKTPLGHHRLAVDASVVGVAGDPPLIEVLKNLEALPTAQPGVGSGAWRTSSPPPDAVQYRALIKRAAVNDVIKFAVRITDPIGRMTERILEIPAGPVLPAPDIQNVTLVQVANVGLVLSWQSSAPVTAPPAGSYMLGLTVTRKQVAQPFPPLRPPGRPSPGEIIVAPLKPIVIKLALDDIPVQSGPGFPPGSEPVVVRRLQGGGANKSYGALCRVAATRITIRITSPDGRFVEHMEEVS